MRTSLQGKCNSLPGRNEITRHFLFFYIIMRDQGGQNNPPGLIRLEGVLMFTIRKVHALDEKIALFSSKGLSFVSHSSV